MIIQIVHLYSGRLGFNFRGKEWQWGQKGRRNRPVIVTKAGDVLGLKEREQIGMQSWYVFYSKLRWNYSQIEDKLQQMIYDEVLESTGKRIPLGLRFHRWQAMGSNMEDVDRKKAGYLAKVFFTIAEYPKVVRFCNVVR